MASLTGVDELTAFLNARLDEDERIAMAATGQRPGQPAEQPEHWRWECTEDDQPLDVDLAIAGGEEFLVHGQHWRVGLRSTEKYPSSAGSYGHLVIDGEEVRPQDARHIARHGPARVLREVNAMRAILRRYTDGDDALWVAVQELTSIWSDHPDYRPEGAPGA